MELVPQPLSHLLRRVRREAPTGQVFDLPTKKMWTGPSGAHDLSRRFHGARAATGVGPAAGPHTQLAQNIALSYLAGARIQELKTVQIMDTLEIPRPCIDAENIGFNVEWSQELRIEQSTEEYAKAALLLAALRKMGLPEGLPPGQDDLLLDLSVGYDLKGIQSDRVTGFIRAMQDAGVVLDRLREGLARDVAEFRDLEVDPRLVECITLSTFHGCPADEIESISRYLLEDLGLHVVVKLNPTLLGFEAVQDTLQTLGYEDLTLDREAFEHDLQWTQAVEMIDRLRRVAKARNRHFGVKLTNTLVVNNHKTFFPASEKQMYMSGQPLHVISTQLLAKLRGTIPLIGDGDTPPIMYTFSAGIDQHNFPLATAADLCPITTCTDLLRPGGYARLPKYLDRLESEMDEVSAPDVDTFILRRFEEAGGALDDMEAALRDRLPAPPQDLRARLDRARDALATAPLSEALAQAGWAGAEAETVRDLWVHAAGSRNARRVAAAALEDPRYAKAKNAKTPKKIGSQLWLFDCVSCDKCVPVCPNDANFVYEVPQVAVDAPQWRFDASGLRVDGTTRVDIERNHQLATFVDACNACGNCDVFCPEDGGPYNEKPHWFGSRAAAEAEDKISGLYLEDASTIAGRLYGRQHRLQWDEARSEGRYETEEVTLRWTLDGDVPKVLEHEVRAPCTIDAAHLVVLKLLLQGVQSTVNPVSAGVASIGGGA